MIQQKGCRSQRLLKCEGAPGERDSCAEWETQADIDAYRDSEAHKQIQNCSREFKTGTAIPSFPGVK
jgi:heme-degrading monooxygenase HmoA